MQNLKPYQPLHMAPTTSFLSDVAELGVMLVLYVLLSIVDLLGFKPGCGPDETSSEEK